jgi:hypothetical protein
MKTVWIYVDTSRDVGDKDHLKVFANTEAAETWFEESDPKVLYSHMRFRRDLYRAAAYRLLAAFLILKSSIRLAGIQFGLI